MESSDEEKKEKIELTKEKILEMQTKTSQEIENFINLLTYYGEDVFLEKHRPNREKFAVGKGHEPLIKISMGTFITKIDKMMKKMTVVLPHSYQVMLQNIICNFSQPVLDMNALNMIFFGNKCPFFPLIQQYYPSEALEFLKAYPFLQQLALNINNILPNEIPLLQQMEIFNKIEF